MTDKQNRYTRIGTIALIGILALSRTTAGEILLDVLADAYLSVAVFVTFTLVLIYGLEKFFNFDFF